ncbi:MAG: ATP-binding protein [Pseudomonas sp.]|uniref:ATP-binding protein n=1 Tax=Pseudomonas abieticivorans TaxID=2931382 RepID=UPI0020BDA679|nr:ATP-binding protein [Pseudomonas sp. PIA16]MDE1169507.1 ATP-binding protein [Pseudomonas sp.]
MTPLLRWPRTLIAQLGLIFFTGLVLAYGLSFAVQFCERYQSSQSMMMGTLEREVGTSVAILDRLPAPERASWLPTLDGRTFHFILGEGEPAPPLAEKGAPQSMASIQRALASKFPVTFTDLSTDVQKHFQAHLRLSDGHPLSIDVRPSLLPIAYWLPAALLVQLLVLIGCAWLAVKVAIRPLTRLARAADSLDPNTRGPRIDESGPEEVAFAARAFNAMQERIEAYLKERMEILGAISHDLQTPLTRMKLRAEFMEDGVEKDKLWHDLGEIEHLVREGIAYARSVHGATEANARIDADAFLESLTFDYQDMHQPVELHGKTGLQLDTRPHALRRVLMNLVDNALKFAGAAQLQVAVRSDGGLSISVLDRGPGIAHAQLGEVLKPFYRLETSRSRDTGGTGLGLAIAQQLALALNATLTLSNREGGGLCAQLSLPA